MKITIIATALFLTAVSAYGQAPKPTLKGTRDAQATSPQDTYVITAHTSVPTNSYSNLRDELYTIVYGSDILKVRYSESQTNSAKPGDAYGTGLHEHSSDSNPDLSQIPAAGLAIRACLIAKQRMPDGGAIIDHQPTPAPCMARLGNTLQYRPSPNSADMTYVLFDVLSEEMTTPSMATSAQSAPPGKHTQDPRAVVSDTPVVVPRSTPSRKDIPTIAKAANGAIVSIVMSDKDGQAILRIMYEHLVTASFIAQYPAEAKRFDDNASIQKIKIWNRTVRILPQIKTTIAPDEIQKLEDASKEAKALLKAETCKKCGQPITGEAWTRASVEEMARKVDAVSGSNLASLYTACFLVPTSFIHPTAFGLESRSGTIDDGLVFKDLSEPEAHDAVMRGHGLILRLLKQQNNYFQLGLDDELAVRWEAFPPIWSGALVEPPPVANQEAPER